jgi:hypothetical protein
MYNLRGYEKMFVGFTAHTRMDEILYCVHSEHGWEEMY